MTRRSTWQDLVATAVVGTERRAVPPGMAVDIAGVLGDEVPAGSTEERLLVAAAVLGTWRRAGVSAQHGQLRLPHPAPDDERPVASAKALQLLELLLDGHAAVGSVSTDLAAEWLARCQRSGHCLPAGMLPRVMDAATAARGLRAPAAAVGGRRLRWLAARNPAWVWARVAVDADAEQVWTEGSPAERLAVLTDLRASDPARALAMLTGTWKSEPAADRARFVASLATGLSLDDEPFLEAALDDRSKAVRAAAAALLATLPGSALARRMIARLRPLVSVQRRGLRGRERLAVEPPVEIDAAAARDGIVAAGAPPHTGRRAWALIQIIAATPLDFWERELRAGPQEIIGLGAGSDTVIDGWARAAARQRNVTWAHHLLPHRPDPALLTALSPAVAQGELAAVLPRVDDADVGGLVAAVPGPWRIATSRAVLARLRAIDNRQALLQALPALATALDPATAPDVETWLSSLRGDDPARTRLHTVSQALSLRQAIAEELS